MQERNCFTPIFYVRGYNPPYTEGGIQVVNNIVKALLSQGIRSVIFNYSYNLVLPTYHQYGCEKQFEHKIPIFNREEVFHGGRKSTVVYSSLMEAFATLRFLLMEKNLCASTHFSGRRYVANIVNCFRYPRVFAKKFLPNDIVLHFYMRKTIMGSLANIIVDKADKILTTSRTLAHYIEKTCNVNRKKVEILYPPIDVNLYKPIDKIEARKKLGLSDEDRIILYMGNLRRNRFPEKIVLKTLHSLVKANFKTQLMIFTPVNNENIERSSEIKEKTKKLNLTANVKIKVKDLSENERRAVYSGSDIFLFPSLDHATAIEPPLTILEAMSSGLPVVSNNISSVCEIISDGVNGVILNLKNEESSKLTDKVSSILTNEETRSKLSSNARRSIVEKVSFDNSCKKLLQFYKRTSE